jgi:hypothetical protein
MRRVGFTCSDTDESKLHTEDIAAPIVVALKSTIGSIYDKGLLNGTSVQQSDNKDTPSRHRNKEPLQSTRSLLGQPYYRRAPPPPLQAFPMQVSVQDLLFLLL